MHIGDLTVAEHEDVRRVRPDRTINSSVGTDMSFLDTSVPFDRSPDASPVVYEAPLVIMGPHDNVQVVAAKVRAFLRRVEKPDGLRVELKDGLWAPARTLKPER
jgi:hypothetical protein